MEEWPFPQNFIPNAGRVVPPGYWLPTNGAASHASETQNDQHVSSCDDNQTWPKKITTRLPSLQSLVIYLEIFVF